MRFRFWRFKQALLVLQVQILLQRRGLSLNPITTMYYIAPASFLFLCVPWGVIEARQLFADDKVVYLLSHLTDAETYHRCLHVSELSRLIHLLEPFRLILTFPFS